MKELKTQKPTTQIQMMTTPISRTNQVQKQAMHQRIDHVMVEYNITLDKEKDKKLAWPSQGCE